MTLDDRLEIVERVWPGTRAKGIHEVSARVVALSAIEEGKDGGASPAEVEQARALLLERIHHESCASPPQDYTARHSTSPHTTTRHLGPEER